MTMVWTYSAIVDPTMPTICRLQSRFPPWQVLDLDTAAAEAIMDTNQPRSVSRASMKQVACIVSIGGRMTPTASFRTAATI